jgi:hypothetical protein
MKCNDIAGMAGMTDMRWVCGGYVAGTSPARRVRSGYGGIRQVRRVCTDRHLRPGNDSSVVNTARPSMSIRQGGRQVVEPGRSRPTMGPGGRKPEAADANPRGQTRTRCGSREPEVADANQRDRYDLRWPTRTEVVDANRGGRREPRRSTRRGDVDATEAKLNGFNLLSLCYLYFLIHMALISGR